VTARSKVAAGAGCRINKHMRHTVIGDNAYDSDKLDAQLRHYGIEVIARTAATEESKHKTNVV